MMLKRLLLSLIILSVYSIPASAESFMIGAKGGYYVWVPYFQDIGGFFESGEKGTGVLYGLAMSALVTSDLSFSVSGLTGKQSTEWSKDLESVGPDDIRAGTYFWTGTRYDLDTALSYRLSEKVKVILGYKYQYIDSVLMQTEGRRKDASPQLTELSHSKDTIKTLSHGPAIGAGYAFVFGDGFFAAANLSFLYMKGYLNVKSDFAYYVPNSTISDEWTPKTDGIDLNCAISQTGMNFEPSLGYKPAENGLIFTLGFRFQWLRTKFENLTQDEESNLTTKTMNDYQYGIFVSVLYSI